MLLWVGWSKIAANAGHQARLEAAATQERRLSAVACMLWLGVTLFANK
jgi:hypothetical protein